MQAAYLELGVTLSCAHLSCGMPRLAMSRVRLHDGQSKMRFLSLDKGADWQLGVTYRMEMVKL